MHSQDLENLIVRSDCSDTDFFIKYKHPETHQTYELHFYHTDTKESKEANRVWSWVCLAVYSKRKSADSNEYLKLSTGKDPMFLFVFLRHAFPLLEKRLLLFSWCSNLPCALQVVGSNGKRQKLYDSLLMKHGFERSKSKYTRTGLVKNYSVEEIQKKIGEDLH